MDTSNNKIIGLTGGIGSGKTVATDALKENGYCVIDADEISRELFARGTDGEKMLYALFPAAVENGALDRRKLRELISHDEILRQKLNAVTHPIITARVREDIAAANTHVILSAPLLFESGLYALCDVTVCVTCSMPERIKRVMLRDGITEDAAQSIIAAQLTDDEREQASDVVISSDCPIDRFKRRVLKELARITAE